METKPMPQTLESLNAEIAACQPISTKCAGSAYDWKHFPELCWVSSTLAIRCGCGKVFEGNIWDAPTNQPAPELWSAFQKFKQHYQEKLEEAV